MIGELTNADGKTIEEVAVLLKNPVVCNSGELDSYNFFHAWL